MELKCPWILCQFNSSYQSGKAGECLNVGTVELKVKDLREISGMDYIPDSLEDEELMYCDSIIYSQIKADKIWRGK